MQVTTQRDLMSLPQAAQRLGQSWERTWRMMLSGRIAGEKRGGRWFVNTVDVETVRSGQSDSKPAA